MSTLKNYEQRLESVRDGLNELTSVTIACVNGDSLIVKTSLDLDLKWGAVIIDDEGRVYLRTAGKEDEYWCEAARYQRGVDECSHYLFSLEGFYDFLREQVGEGRSFRFLRQTESRWGLE